VLALEKGNDKVFGYKPAFMKLTMNEAGNFAQGDG
jgi:hypothetical protein